MSECYFGFALRQILRVWSFRSYNTIHLKHTVNIIGF